MLYKVSWIFRERKKKQQINVKLARKGEERYRNEISFAMMLRKLI